MKPGFGRRLSGVEKIDLVCPSTVTLLFVLMDRPKERAVFGFS
ncbi:hypothetical protein HMPREF1141_2152 [Clostridium sp. MSTE9]|nr:hypothetical protein HMPREF1141_2152 [Clostridium sp. MSTE9]